MERNQTRHAAGAAAIGDEPAGDVVKDLVHISTDTLRQSPRGYAFPLRSQLALYALPNSIREERGIDSPRKWQI